MTPTTGPTASGFLRSTCRALFAHPLVRWFDTPPRRRGLVVGFGVLLAGLPGFTFVAEAVWPIIVMSGPLLLATLLLAGVTDALFDRPLHTLDERQRHLRQTVFDNPYVTGAGIGIGAGICVALAVRTDDPIATSWALVAMMGTFLLPTLVLAWKLPARVDDGD